MNMNPNQKGLFDISDSNLSVTDCQFEQIYDINNKTIFSNQV